MSELRDRFIDEISLCMGEFVRAAVMVAITQAHDPRCPTKVEICDALRELTAILVDDVQKGGMDEALGVIYRLLGVGDE